MRILLQNALRAMKQDEYINISIRYDARHLQCPVLTYTIHSCNSQLWLRRLYMTRDMTMESAMTKLLKILNLTDWINTIGDSLASILPGKLPIDLWRYTANFL